MFDPTAAETKLDFQVVAAALRDSCLNYPEAVMAAYRLVGIGLEQHSWPSEGGKPACLPPVLASDAEVASLLDTPPARMRAEVADDKVKAVPWAIVIPVLLRLIERLLVK